MTAWPTFRSRAMVADVLTRPRTIGVTDARTGRAHRVTDDEAAAGRHSGCYEAICGARVLAASLTAPDRGRCRPCARAGAR
ncbi:MAG: hypothetical protein ACR2FQ_03675 [Pseudonocardiaceae bacterium]